MINRRIIRTKVLQTLFSYNSHSLESLDEADKNIKYTFDRIYDLYFKLKKVKISIYLVKKNYPQTPNFSKTK